MAITVILRALTLLVLIYLGWLVFRVVHDWLGLVFAIVAVLLLPISIPVVTVAMLFIHSEVAGPLSPWLGIIAMGILDWVARRTGRSLLFK
jgi:hypothetical protein